MARLAGTLKPDFSYDDFRNSEGRLDYDAMSAAEKAWLEAEKEKLRKSSASDVVGEEVRFQVADGYASYIVTKVRPLTVVHIGLGDAYQAHGATIRGLNLAEVRHQVEGDRRWKEAAKKRGRETQAVLEAHEGKFLHFEDFRGTFIRYKVVRATVAEHDPRMPDNSIAVGDLVLEANALVGDWKDYDLEPTSYQAERILSRAQRLAGNLYDCYETNERIRERNPVDPNTMEPCQIKAPKHRYEIDFTSKAEFTLGVEARDEKHAQELVDELLQKLLSGRLHSADITVLVSDPEPMLSIRKAQ
jgi:hypothetical protein